MKARFSYQVLHLMSICVLAFTLFACTAGDRSSELADKKTAVMNNTRVDTTSSNVSLAMPTSQPVLEPVKRPNTSTLDVQNIAVLGDTLVAGEGSREGYTLYALSSDSTGLSLCAQGCEDTWLPYIVRHSKTVSLAQSVVGSVGHILRDDGQLQATYNNKPLYFYQADEQRGDALGHGVSNVWWAVTVQEPLLSLGSLNELRDSFVATYNDRVGMSVYTYTGDASNMSHCYGECATVWPPVLVNDAKEASMTSGLSGHLGIITRTDGTLQVTLNGLPLYFHSADIEPGDTVGQGLDGEWWLATATPQAISVVHVPELGDVLTAGVGSRLGFTLYTFAGDVPRSSACYEDCAAAWPPYIISNTDTMQLNERLPGQLSYFTRQDGRNQLSYNGKALHFYVADQKPRDTQGHLLGGGLWQVASVQPDFIVDTLMLDGFGQILVAGQGDKAGFALYTFDHDQEHKSHCYDECSEVWQPLIVPDEQNFVVPAALQRSLNTTVRADGHTQVTYLGQPLYLYSGDQYPGEIQGQGLEELWFLVSPFCAGDPLDYSFDGEQASCASAL